jgi:hypothetical protein
MHICLGFLQSSVHSKANVKPDILLYIRTCLVNISLWKVTNIRNARNERNMRSLLTPLIWSLNYRAPTGDDNTYVMNMIRAHYPRIASLCLPKAK